MPGPAAIAGLTAGTGLVGDVLGGIFGSSAQKKANRTNIQLQREQQRWEERMSNTSWQRGTQDMLAAGINPMLSFSQGGASTPNVSAATVQPEDAWAKATTSAASRAAQAVSIAQGLANIDLTKANTVKAVAEGKSSAAQAENATVMSNLQVQLVNRQVDNLISQAHLTDEQRKQIEQMLPLLIAASKTATQLQQFQIPSARAEAKLWEDIGETGKGVGFAAGVADAIKKAITVLKGGK